MDGHSYDKDDDEDIDSDDLYHNVCVGAGFVFNDPDYYSDGWTYYPGSTFSYTTTGQVDNDDLFPNSISGNGGGNGGDTVPEFSTIGFVLSLFAIISILLYMWKNRNKLEIK